MRVLLPALALALCLGAGTAWCVDKVSVRGLFKDKAILVIDGRQRLLHAGETSPEGVTLVSANSREALLEIAGERVTRGLGNDIGGTFEGPRETSVRIWPTSSNMYPVVGSIEGLPVNFVVDTGATYVSMNANEAKRLGIDYLVEGDKVVSSTASGLADAYVVTLDEVRVGDVELRNVKAAVHDGDFPEVVLLGMSFLGRLDMNREGGVLELKKKH